MIITPVGHYGMLFAVLSAFCTISDVYLFFKLWDAVYDRFLWAYDYPRNNPIVAITTLPAPSKCVVAVMAEGTAR